MEQTQTFHCSHCGTKHPSINTLFLHMFTTHLGRDTGLHPMMSKLYLVDTREYRHPMCRERN